MRDGLPIVLARVLRGALVIDGGLVVVINRDSLFEHNVLRIRLQIRNLAEVDGCGALATVTNGFGHRRRLDTGNRGGLTVFNLHQRTGEGVLRVRSKALVVDVILNVNALMELGSINLNRVTPIGRSQTPRNTHMRCKSSL